ncbi:putative Histidine kinase [uncultured delta proteobacterium]|uniref:histidine kinase n=1 Tax=uncultured delta proteobacterium TaxID=34034 RepID=A0A212IX47_9DELT|nr:putative Histidine kinase [uncultured delta proteobacterium]
MRHLWQRIFAYALILVIVSQVAVLILHRYSINRDEARRYIADYTRSLAAAVDGGTAPSADTILKVFNRKRDRVWIEDAGGRIIAGALPERGRPGAAVGRIGDDGPVMLETGDPDWYVGTMPLRLQEGEATLFMLFGPPRHPDIWTLFFQGFIFVSVIGLLLALWMAWRVSKPLRVLRDEVMKIAGGNLESRVTVRGRDEITDVAKAVNHMADTLARNIRSMRELVANISHEMRSPLARMQVSLAMLEEDVAREPKAAARLTLLNEELNHMNKLIGATLLTSKLDLQAPVRPEGMVAFSGLCAEACRRHAPLFSQEHLQFTREIQEGITFPGDETLLTTLVSNLLDNAAKYTDPSGVVSLRLFEEDGHAALAVENSHAPLPDELLQRIFEPFHRGGVATGGGVGLGLSLVRKIAQLHGGDVAAANTGSGVRFTARIPLRPSASPASPPSSPSPLSR